MSKHPSKPLLVLALVAAAFALRAEVATAARWIWYPEPVRESERQQRFFVKTVELPAAPKAGTINFAADDACLVWVNGKYFGNTGMPTLKVPASALKAGRNTIAVRGGNVTGPGGVLVRGEITLADGQKIVIVSDKSWQTSRTEPKGWPVPAGEPKGDNRVPAQELRGVDADFVWRQKINRADFMSKEELAAGTPLALLPGATGGESEARWIWVPESLTDSRNQKRYFIKEIDLPAVPVDGTLNFAADDACVVWINGVQRGDTGFKGLSLPAKLLRAGKNVIAVRGWNNVGHAGVVMRGEFTLADGSKRTIVSDGSWLCCKKEVENWNKVDFKPGREWVPAENLRGVNAPHLWRKHLKRRELFLSRAEIEAANRETRENAENTERYRKEVAKRLADEPNPSVKVASRNGVAGFLADGKFFSALIYKGAAIPAHESEGRQRIRSYADAGFHLYQVSATIDNDFGKHFNPQVVDARLLGVLGADPDARLIVEIGLYTSSDLKKETDELVGYGSGNPYKPGSDAMTGTPPVLSFASLKWRAETGEAARQLIRRLEASPFGKRILGYHFIYGVYAEWHSFGMWCQLPDTGVAMTKAYRRFLKAKYGTDAALRKAWGNPSATIDGALPPAKEKRLTLGCFSLRDPATEREVLDFDECQANEVNAAQLHFARIVKEETQGKKITGFYSGYFFANGFPVSGWQPKTPEVLASGLVDYQSSPYNYGQRRMGQTSLPRSVIDTYPLQGRMNIFESDTRPHFVRTENPGHTSIVHTFNTEEDIAALSRDFAQAFTHGAGFWLYDFSENNWFARPQFMPMLRQFARIAAAGLDCRRASEVAFVCDFASVPLQFYAAGPNPVPDQLIAVNAPELCYAGAPYDAILTEDLLAGRAPEYKLYIFSNLVRRTPELEKLAADLRAKGKTILWLYAPGLISERGIDPAGIEKLTGVKVGMIREKLTMGAKLVKSDDPIVAGLGGTELHTLKEGPVFFIDDPAAKALGHWPYDGKPHVTFGAKRIGKSLAIYSAAPRLNRELFRNILKTAGVHLYTADTKDVLFANRSLVGIHTVTGGEKTLRLPKKARRITRVLPDEAVVAENTDTVKFTTPKTATVLFKVEY